MELEDAQRVGVVNQLRVVRENWLRVVAGNSLREGAVDSSRLHVVCQGQESAEGEVVLRELLTVIQRVQVPAPSWRVLKLCQLG